MTKSSVQNIDRFTTHNQRGVSAIFIVIFATILLSLISVSFIGLMLKDSSRSTDDEQSQGAYDAAMAGIEDGKRVLLECNRGTNSTQKQNACDAINAKECSTAIDAGIAGSAGDDEVAVQSSSSGGNELNLAYTCVIVSPDTPDYVGVLGDNDSSAVIPLRSVAGFSHVDVYWFDRNDAETPQVPNVATTDLPTLNTTNWPVDRPPVLRVQVMQYKDGNLVGAQFDDNSYAHTLYLYPSQIGLSSMSAGLDGRRSGTASPQLAWCNNGTYPVNGYSCHVSIALPGIPEVGATPANRRTYLRLTSIYNGANYKVVLNNSGAVVNFDNAQPSIDSTGRANDLFRRVETRVGIVSDLPYPRATVDINGNFCKTFSVGSAVGDYNAGSCTP